MKIDIEDIKALDPGKIYAVSLDITDLGVAESMAETLTQAGKDFDLSFIFIAKGRTELISAPEGLEVTLI